jgi:radical SAM protein with 4Fe4S-binding SPASM domain
MAADADILNIARNAINTGSGIAEAINWVTRALELFPEDPVLSYLLGALYLKSNNLPRGARALGEAQRLMLAPVKVHERAPLLARAAEYAQNRQLLNGVNGNYFSYLSFQENQSAYAKRRAFKDSVSYIEFETSSMCNRVCHYCPNAQVDRRSHNIIMDEAVFNKVIGELAEIDYDHIINMSGYNEPLADHGIVGRIATARRMLPNVYLRIHSNGDYLKRDYLEELRDAGLSNIQVSIHRQPHEPFSMEAAVDRVHKMTERLGTGEPIIQASATGVTASLPFGGLDVNMFQIDYENYGLNRAGLLDGVGQQIVGRTDPCTLPIYLFTIHYNGNVMPCCHFVGDNENHQQYVCGNVADSSIFDIYSSKELIGWRNGLFNRQVKQAPCDSCTRDVGLPFNQSAVFAQS